jgi:capsular polysaccharide export protein
VDGRAVSTALFHKQNSSRYARPDADRVCGPASNEPRAAEKLAQSSFLRVPPFPGAKIRAFTFDRLGCTVDSDLVALLRTLKVGGSYWAAQPDLPDHYVLVTDRDALGAAAKAGFESVVFWTESPVAPEERASVVIRGECDPWHVLARASALLVREQNELSSIAAILGVPVLRFDRATATLVEHAVDPKVVLGEILSASYENPFTGALIGTREAIELCAFWRDLVDSNRGIEGGIGFAFWKQEHVAPLLWSGTGPFQFVRSLAKPKGAVAVWRAKASAEQISALEEAHFHLIEVEDGFLRSQGLGADCIPPLSITIDREGAYFDPTKPSELELMLAHGVFDEELLARARRLRVAIVEAGLGKYERGRGTALRRPAGKRRHILVPGQVEDDRAVQSGGCGLVSNLELLKRVRAAAQDAYIIYKPHPDVVAGHRRGAISRRACLELADEVAVGLPISTLIDMVDEVHVNTSLAGFEALLREKPVTTHGVPFYAGWGLTRDLGPVPRRRKARRSLDELVAASLLIYPRYLDPVTGLPCPAEVVVERLTNDASRPSGLIVLMRRLQGRLMRGLRGEAS